VTGVLPKVGWLFAPGRAIFVALLLLGLSSFVVAAFVECKGEWQGDVFYLLLLVMNF
jgi:hypothetical protein